MVWTTTSHPVTMDTWPTLCAPPMPAHRTTPYGPARTGVPHLQGGCHADQRSGDRIESECARPADEPPTLPGPVPGEHRRGARLGLPERPDSAGAAGHHGAPAHREAGCPG